VRAFCPLCVCIHRCVCAYVYVHGHMCVCILAQMTHQHLLKMYHFSYNLLPIIFHFLKVHTNVVLLTIWSTVWIIFFVLFYIMQLFILEIGP
jgi:hypothetical protein